MRLLNFSDWQEHITLSISENFKILKLHDIIQSNILKLTTFTIMAS